MKIQYITIVVFCLIIFLSNCRDNKGKTGNARFTMREDSEMTLLMRDMFEYYDSLKVNIENGEIPEQIRVFNEVHSAVSTEPEKGKSELYQAMATVYKESADRLKNNRTDMPKYFNQMIDNCMNCHQQMCPGPMVKIKKLYLENI